MCTVLYTLHYSTLLRVCGAGKVSRHNIAVAVLAISHKVNYIKHKMVLARHLAGLLV